MRNESGQKIPSKSVMEERGVRQFILERANEIPPMYTDHSCTVWKTGAEILNMPSMVKNMTKDQIEAIQLKKKYPIEGTQTLRVNHFQRMMKLAKKKGPTAAVEYYKQALQAALVPDTNKIGNITPELDYGSTIRNY